MAVLSLPDRRDHMSLPYAAIAWRDLDADVKGLRLGLLLDVGLGLPVAPEVRAVIEAAPKAFEAAGAIVEPMPPFLMPAMLDGLDRFWRTRALADLSALPADRRARVLPFIRAWAEGAATLSGAEVFAGFSQVMAMRAAAHAASGAYDFLLSPTAPLAAFAAELPSPTDDPARPFEHIGFTVAFNMSDQPASSVNAGYTAAGVPIGLQIIGRRFDDLGVLRLSHAWETLRDPQRPWPTCG
jgi:aspartyl-tRNA(Asn)/glutamyl-tRNA(Gln) amidotransferase subunit A